MHWIDLLSGLVLLHASLTTVAAVAGVLSNREHIRRLTYGLLSAVALMQTGVVLGDLLLNEPVALTRAFYLECLAWLLSITGLVVWKHPRLRSMVLIVAPFTLIVVLASMLLGQQSAVPEAASSFFNIHVICVFPALVCMAVACGAGALFLLQEQTIKCKQPMTAFRRSLPALATLDKVNAVCSMAGFPLYSLGIVFGMVAARLTWGSLLSGDPKELVSFLVWTIYAFLFHQRLAKGWRGRKPALLALMIFGVALFSLFGVNLFMNTHHSFF